jgi:signal peptide peptidase SppA
MPADLPPIRVPSFPRCEDWFGEWAYEQVRFEAMWRMIAVTNLPAHVAAGPPPKPQTLTQMKPGKGGKNIAVISATGTLMKSQSSFGGTSTIQLRKEIRAAADDPNVSAILLHIDSPGGTVAGTAAVADDIRRTRLGRAGKPVWAFIDDLGASAAYWIASQAGAIYAGTSTTLVGSIGTVLRIPDSAEAAAREGVKVHVFSTGPHKAAGTPGAPVTDEHVAYFQGVVTSLQVPFDDAVKSGRNMSRAEYDAVRTGGVWTAKDALNLKLIDGIKSIDATIEALAAVK